MKKELFAIVLVAIVVEAQCRTAAKESAACKDGHRSVHRVHRDANQNAPSSNGITDTAAFKYSWNLTDTKKISLDTPEEAPNNEAAARFVNVVKRLLDGMKETDVLYKDELSTGEHIRIKRATPEETTACMDHQMRIVQGLTDTIIKAQEIFQYFWNCYGVHQDASTDSELESNNDVARTTNEPNAISID